MSVPIGCLTQPDNRSREAGELSLRQRFDPGRGGGAGRIPCLKTRPEFREIGGRENKAPSGTAPVSGYEAGSA